MSRFDLLIGLPGSGKSTFAREMAKKNKNTIIVNRDSLRTMLKGTYSYEKDLENLVREAAGAIVDKAVRLRFDVIVDETNLTKKKRAWWHTLLPVRHEVTLGFSLFPQWKRNLEFRMKEPRGYDEEDWKDVIRGMKESFEMVDPSEKFDILYIVKNPFDTENLSLAVESHTLAMDKDLLHGLNPKEKS